MAVTYRDFSSTPIRIHGTGVANCSYYPEISLKFRIYFDRTGDNNNQRIVWHTEGMSNWGHPTSGGYGYRLFAYVEINNTGKHLVLSKSSITGTNWWNHVTLSDTGEQAFDTTSTQATLRVWVKCRDSCQHGDHVWCYPGTGYTEVYSTTIDLPVYELQYTVSYNANGGSPTPGNQIKSSLSNLTLTNTRPSKSVVVKYYNNGTSTPSNIVAPALTFNNWSASNGGTYNPGGTYTKNEDCVMTAQWGSGSFIPIALPAKYYRVTYIYNAGTGSPAYTDLQRQALGYSKASGSTAVVYHPGVSYTVSTNLNLYPVYGDAILQFSSLPTPTRNGYSFGGWYRDASFNTKVTTNLTITGDTVLYAKWVALPIHKRNLDGTWSDDGPWVWKYTTSDNQWHKIAPVYKYDSTKSDWENISGGLPNV